MAQMQCDVMALSDKVDRLSEDMQKILSLLVKKEASEAAPSSWWGGGGSRLSA